MSVLPTAQRSADTLAFPRLSRLPWDREFELVHAPLAELDHQRVSLNVIEKRSFVIVKIARVLQAALFKEAISPSEVFVVVWEPRTNIAHVGRLNFQK